MDILDQIAEAAREKNLRFLVIGGHAVMANRYPRQTTDLDLLIRNSDRDEWTTLLAICNYTQFRDGGSFLQFKHASEWEWPLDLMLVSPSTFENLWKDATEARFAKCIVRVPSVLHLIALKAHALKGLPEHRALKDLNDVIMLIDNNGMDIKSTELHDTIIKHGGQDLYERIARAFGNK